MVESLKKPKKKKKNEDSEEEKEDEKKAEETQSPAKEKDNDSSNSNESDSDKSEMSEANQAQDEEKAEQSNAAENKDAAAGSQQIQRTITMGLTDERKYELVIKRYFDLLSIKLPYTQKNARRTRKKVKDLCTQKALVAGKLKLINAVIAFLKKPTDRKSDKEADLVMPILNQFPIKVHGN